MLLARDCSVTAPVVVALHGANSTACVTEAEGSRIMTLTRVCPLMTVVVWQLVTMECTRRVGF